MRRSTCRISAHSPLCEHQFCSHIGSESRLCSPGKVLFLEHTPSEMSLRDLVTGSDSCSAGDGAGPSNAFAGLANSILGTSSKDQERLREVNLHEQNLHFACKERALSSCCKWSHTLQPRPGQTAFSRVGADLQSIVNFQHHCVCANSE